jgi:predicted phage replisome organizer
LVIYNFLTSFIVIKIYLYKYNNSQLSTLNSQLIKGGVFVAEEAIWIKIATGIFRDDKIEEIERLPNGDTTLVIWFKLLTLAGRCNAGGYLRLVEGVPFDNEMLADKFKKKVNIIDRSLAEFERLKMLQRTSGGIYITNFNKYQRLDKMNEMRAQDNLDNRNQKREKDRIRQEKYRIKKKLLADSHKDEVVAAEEKDMSQVMSQKNECDKERDYRGDSSYSNSTSTSNSSSNSNSIISFNSSRSYIKFFNSNFHRITDHEEQVLLSYEKKGMDPQVITLAIKEAVEKNVRDLGYVNKILERWVRDKILTVDAVKADKEQFERKKNTAQDSTRNATGKPSTFNNFQQREYDYDSLEKQLLGWGE